MKTDNLLQQKSYAFAVRIVKMCQFLTDTKKEFVLSKQVLRSGTSSPLTQFNLSKPRQPTPRLQNFTYHHTIIRCHFLSPTAPNPHGLQPTVYSLILQPDYYKQQ